MFNLSTVRDWVASRLEEISDHGNVFVTEPTTEHGAISVDVDLQHTLAQVLLWPTGSLEIRIVDVESEKELVNEHREVAAPEELACVLESTRRLIRRRCVSQSPQAFKCPLP